MNKLKLTIKENSKYKIITNDQYNVRFNKLNGYMERKGFNHSNDPQVAPMFEHLDWELSSSCDHCCPWCYKSCMPSNDTIDIDTFKSSLDKIKSMNPILMQIAYGVGSLNYIPHLEDILKYTRSKNIIPNITIASHEYLHGMGVDDQLHAIRNHCGAVAISNYKLEDTILMVDYMQCDMNNVPSKLAQVNVHQFLSMETYNDAMKILQEVKDNSYFNPNAIVFLWVKPKGRAQDNFHPITQSMLDDFISYALSNNISIGFDSCSSPMCLCNKQMEQFKDVIESCESTLFSAYLDTTGNFYPCSFSNDQCKGIHINNITNIDDLWQSETFTSFRKKLLTNNRECPLFNLCVGG